MAQVNLPITSRTSSDDNNFADVYGNDLAIINVLNGHVDTDNLEDNAVTGAKIRAGEVSTSELQNASVTADKIADNNVTTAKINDLAVTTGKIADGDVTTAKIEDDAVTAAKLADAAKLGLDESGTVRRGKSIIATEESRSNVAYGTLTTPDRVENVVLPTDGLIVVAYQALFKATQPNVGRAAIFIGASQVKRRNDTDAAPVVDEAETDASNNYVPVATRGGGLRGGVGANSTADVTTGQIVGTDESAGGSCYIFAAAGTYTISVQFKATSGSVTAKERKLWVWTVGF